MVSECRVAIGLRLYGSGTPESSPGRVPRRSRWVLSRAAADTRSSDSDLGNSVKRRRSSSEPGNLSGKMT